MFPEGRFIPFNASDFEFKSVVVFAPHPDDEIIGMGGSLIKLKNCGCDIHLVFVTSGDQGGKASVRTKEAKSVAKKLQAKAQFLKYSDRKVQASEKTIEEVSQLIREIQPEAVFFPSPQEYHPDHRVTAALVWAAQKEIGYPGKLYHYEISRQSEANKLVDITHEAAEKLELLNLYKSQVSQNNYTSVMEALNIARTYTLAAQVERAEGFFHYGNNNAELVGTLRERAFLCLSDPLPSDSPKISILIRTKDRLKTLERTIKSVNEQTYSGEIELIIVNDGGQEVNEVTSKYQKDFSRIEVVNLPATRGRAAAANIAMLNAEGEFFNFIDDDDEFDPEHIQVFIGNWRRNREIKVLYRGVRVLDSEGGFIRNYNEPFDISRIMFMNFIPIHAVTFSRAFFDMGCRFDEEMEFYEDWDFWIQVARYSKFYHSPRITATYHLVGSSAASPHMQKLIDPSTHINKVRDKWLKLCSPIELVRVLESRIK